jgi:hypothetical protein
MSASPYLRALSAVVVALAGIMFESGQLSGGLKEALSGIIMFLVVCTIVYFFWVLTTELWIAFWPGSKIWWFYDPYVDRDNRVSMEQFDVAALGHAVTDANSAAKNEDETTKLQGEVETLTRLVASQMQEINALKKQASSTSMFKGGVTKAMAKKKFGFAAFNPEEYGVPNPVHEVQAHTHQTKSPAEDAHQV